MEITTVAVLGGSGFVGRHVCHALAADGIRVRVATRDRERAKENLILLPTVEVEELDVHDPQQLAAFVGGADAVINLVGVLHPSRGSGAFEAAHVELARTVVSACRSRGIRRLLHMSAVGADPAAPSRYLRTKGEAEAIVRAAPLSWTIFRPSVIFGPGDRFLNLFAQLLRFSPVVALACPGARFQPVFVEDVAAAFVRSLHEPSSAGATCELCGPRVYTLRELVEYTAAVTGHRRWIVGLGSSLSYALAFIMEWLPVKLLSRDNYRSMQVDSVCRGAFPFGIVPTALEAVAPSYLGKRTPRARYQGFRAGRGQSVTGNR